jgi:diguanylate cyclase (GGDEF)-like protein/PAS domain S-box-containing protein
VGQLTRTIVANILLATAYFSAGLFTLTLSLPPSNAIPLWAPAGIALAAVLIWGYRLLPGVFLGDFLIAVNLIGFNDSISSGLCLMIGFQAMFQAWLGRWLLVHFKVWPNTLVFDKDIIKFLLLAGGVSSLLPALLAIAVELQLGVLTANTWLEPFIVWWIGSALGIVIFSPIVLILFASPRPDWRTRLLSVAAPMLFLFVGLVAALHWARNIDNESFAQNFDVNARLAHSIIENELEVHKLLVESMTAYFQNSDQVTEQEFSAYLADLSHHQAEVFAAVWIEKISDTDRAIYEQKNGYSITQLDEHGQGFIPAKQRNEYYVVKFTQTHKKHTTFSSDTDDFRGFDICSVEQRQWFCQQLNKIDQPVVLDTIMTVLHPEKHKRFMYVSPVKGRGQDVVGMVAHALDYEVFGAGLLNSKAMPWIEFMITDVARQQVLYATFSDRLLAEVSERSPLKFKKEVTVGSQQWQFDYYPTQQFISTYATWNYYWIITGAFFVLSLLCAFLLSASGRVQQVRQEVDNKTDEIQQNAKLLAKSEEKYRRLIENIKDAYLIYSYDMEGVCNYISPSVKQILGYSQEEFLKDYASYMPDTKNNRKVNKFIEETLVGGQATKFYEVEVLNKQGELHTLEVASNPAYNDSGNIIGVEGIARDITESKEARSELEKLSLALKHSPNAVVITDRNGVIEYVNPKFAEITGYRVDEAVGKWPEMVSSGNTSREIYQDLWDTVLSGHEWRGELQNKKKNGDLYWAQELIAPILDENGNVTHIVATQEDITEAKKQNEQTSYQASHDRLTGLINRQEFDLRLDRIINSAKHDMTEHALCFMDLDQFKIVNDTCGHIAGDELLRQIGSLMQNNIRQRDTLARLGGDEFGLLMEHCGVEQAFETCQKLITLLEDFRFHWDDHIFTLGVSIGLAIIDQHIRDGSEVLHNADGACYEAKNSGRNRVHVHTEDDARLQQRMGEIQWRSVINDALQQDRFLLYVQPITSLASSSSSESYEILLRLEMPDGRIVPPGAFLPAAERYNSATRIDRWVVEHTLHWISRHSSKLNHISTISINLSGQSMGDEAMLGFIIKQFEQGDVPAEKIKFEITETAAVANLRDATVFIKTLRDYGCRFALDDFGSGLSSFAYLKNLKVDSLKIDGMFVRDMLTDPLDYEMVKSINQIGHVMGLETIAEFAENDEIIDKLREIGVDHAQGFTLGEPVPIESLLAVKKEVQKLKIIKS